MNYDEYIEEVEKFSRNENSEVREPTKLSMFDMDIQKKLDVLELAEQLGNVSEAAKICGVSRDTIYRHRKLIR